MNWLRFECCFAFVVSFVGFKEGEGTLKCCQVNLPEDDYMVNPRIKKVSRPLLLGDEHVESRTTLFEGGEMMQPNLRSLLHQGLQLTPSRHGLQR